MSRTDPHHQGKPAPNWNATKPTTRTTMLQTTVLILVAPAKATTPRVINIIPNTTVFANTSRAGTLLSDRRPVISSTPPTSVNTPPSTAKTIASWSMLFEATESPLGD